MSVTGRIFDIQRFCTHDGPGIRTVVFLKGCPLHCPWCHNPESISPRKQLFYTPDLCIGCGKCVEVCPEGAQQMQDGVHVFNRSNCRLCLQCAEVCCTGALETAGRDVTAEEALAEAARDRVFYEESGGGLTLSGGEPMWQMEFTREILSLARREGINTCVETSGWGAAEDFEQIAPDTDIFLWDVKGTGAGRLKEMTGADLEQALANLRTVDGMGIPSVLRCIMLKGLNSSGQHWERIAGICRSLKHCQRVDVLPFHRLGASKHQRLGTAGKDHPEWEPSTGEVEEARRFLRERLNVPVR